MINSNLFLKTHIAILFFIAVFFISSCGTYRYSYMNKEYPGGNSELSTKDYKICFAKVPQSVKDNATKTTYVMKPVYIAGTPGVFSGGIINTSSLVCEGICASARRVKSKIISKCMSEKGWTWGLLKENDQVKQEEKVSEEDNDLE